MTAEDYDDTKNLTLFVQFFLFLIVVIKQV